MSLYDFNKNIVSSEGSSPENLPIRIRVAHWNVGHFGAGGSNSIVSVANEEKVALKYKELFNEINPQLIGLCEYEEIFAKNGTNKTKDSVFSAYGNSYVSTTNSNGYFCNAFFVNGLNATGKPHEVLYRDGYGGAKYYYIVCTIKGKNVYFVETHLNWEKKDVRTKEMQELISAFSNSDYVVLMGDFNCGKTEYDIFKNNGYTLVNGGYTGYLITAPSNSSSIDNIIVKGFAPIDMHVSAEAAEITNGATNATGTKLHASDHLLLYTDLVML